MDIKTALASRLDQILNIPIYENVVMEKRRQTARRRFQAYSETYRRCTEEL